MVLRIFVLCESSILVWLLPNIRPLVSMVCFMELGVRVFTIALFRVLSSLHAHCLLAFFVWECMVELSEAGRERFQLSEGTQTALRYLENARKDIRVRYCSTRHSQLSYTLVESQLD